MANSKQARKRARQAEGRRVLKASQRSMVRTYIKRVIKAINGGDHAQAMAEFKVVSTSSTHRISTSSMRRSLRSRNCSSSTMRWATSWSGS